jgi:hypothetical protein
MVRALDVHDCFIRDLPWLRIGGWEEWNSYTLVFALAIRDAQSDFTQIQWVMKEVGRGKMQAGGTYVELKSDGSDIGDI